MSSMTVKLYYNEIDNTMEAYIDSQVYRTFDPYLENREIKKLIKQDFPGENIKFKYAKMY